MIMKQTSPDRSEASKKCVMDMDKDFFCAEDWVLNSFSHLDITVKGSRIGRVTPPNLRTERKSIALELWGHDE